MTDFSVRPLPLAGLKLLLGPVHRDHRGFLSRLFCAEALKSAGWHRPVAQINHTYTAKCAAIRGMHFQIPPAAEMKLVHCIRGKIWDVAVDLRTDSPQYLSWHAELLSAESADMMLIPEGFAHGYQTLSDDVEMIYCHTVAYQPMLQRGINPYDPTLSIGWPLPCSDMSQRDQQLPTVAEIGSAALSTSAWHG